MEALKVIGKVYRVVKPLFQVRSYLYVQVCSLQNNYEVFNAALYVYENEDPSQCLKMLSEKLDIQNRTETNSLIFPCQHIKEVFNDKNISIFFINDYIVPLQRYEKRGFESGQLLQILHGALTSLNQLHTRDIIHGNISLNTCYLVQQRKDAHCRFALNILDTSYFTQEDCFQGFQQQLFQSEGQSLNLNVSYKDDLESLVYVITHLISKGKLFTVQRFQLEWITDSEFLRWKTCDFFKEMIKIIPPELEILIQIYTLAKSLRRSEKPDYIKLIKKVLDLIAFNKKYLKKHGDSKQLVERRKKSKEQFDIGCDVINDSDIIVKMKKTNFPRTRQSNDSNGQKKSIFSNR